MRALAVLGTEPEPQLPGVPLMSETFPGFVARIFHGIWGPPGMPAETVAGLAAAASELVADPWLRERMAPLATRLIGEGPAALDAAMGRDLALWSGIVRERDIRLDWPRRRPAGCLPGGPAKHCSRSVEGRRRQRPAREDAMRHEHRRRG